MDTKKKRVYRFGGKNAEGDGTMRNLFSGRIHDNHRMLCRIL